MNLKYFGMTELVGNSNTGKSAICIEESKKYKTMYFCTTNFSIKRYFNPTDSVLIKIVLSLEDLLVSIRQCKFTNIELLIIDNFESLLDFDCHKKIIKLIRYLKTLVFKLNKKVLVVNNTNSSFLKVKMYFSYKLGLEWEYQVNTRYHLYFKNENRILEIVKCPVEINFIYKIGIEKYSITYQNIYN